MTLTNPTAGLYRIELDGFSVPDGTTEIDVVDSYVAASLGSLVSSDADAAHPSGSSWNPSATLTVLGQPGAGRQLTGTLRVVTDGGATIGTGSLVVESVTE